MRALMNETKNKILSNIIVTTGAFLGFEALSFSVGVYQIKIYVFLAFVIYFFHIFWLTFLFDLHLKKRGVLANAKLNHKGMKMVWEAFKNRVEHVKNWHYWQHYQNYLILPGVAYWSVVVLLFLNPFKHSLKQLIIISATFSLSVAYWFMRAHVSRKLESHESWISILALVKLFAAFLIYSAILGLAWYYGFDWTVIFYSIFALTFLLIYQALFQHNLFRFQVAVGVFAISIFVGLVALWVYAFWGGEYFTGGLVMLAFYNTLWGSIHHYLDKSLTRKVAFEYVFMMILVISILMAGHNFNERVL
jgi:hypothetical protein